MLDPASVQRLIDQSRPAGSRSGGGAFLLAGILGVLALLILFPEATPIPAGLVDLMPWVFLCAVFSYAWWTARRRRDQQSLLTEAVEAVRREDPATAENRLSRLLRRPCRDAAGWFEALLSLASTAEMQKQFASAQIVYETVLSAGRSIPLLSTVAEVGLANALLQSEQLSDAVNRIDKLRRADLPGSARAEVELIALHREVLMGQTADAVDQIESRRELFRRYLSTRAAYGYALFAAALDSADDTERAAKFWEDATLLMPGKKLVERLDVLEPLMKRYPSADRPL